MILVRSLIVCIALAFSFAVCAETPAQVQITKAVVYVPLGKSKSTHALLTMKNTGYESVSLVKVTSPVAKHVNLIPTVDASKISTATLNPWVLSANQTLEMKDNKIYLEFSALKYQISTSDDIEMTLWFSNGKKLAVIAKAKSAYDQDHSH